VSWFSFQADVNPRLGQGQDSDDKASIESIPLIIQVSLFPRADSKIKKEMTQLFGNTFFLY